MKTMEATSARAISLLLMVLFLWTATLACAINRSASPPQTPDVEKLTEIRNPSPKSIVGSNPIQAPTTPQSAMTATSPTPTSLPSTISMATLPSTVTPTATKHPLATATETPALVVTSAATSVGFCRQPIDDYARVTINGEILNRRTALMLDTAVDLYSGPGDLKRVTQGSYTDTLAASFGSHAGGGAVDISIRNPATPSEFLFDETDAMVRALREAGFAAWYRAPNELYQGSAPHIHAIAIGDQELSPAAQEQLTGPHGYFRGMDGLPHDPPRVDRFGGPIICPWMLHLGYADLREEEYK